MVGMIASGKSTYARERAKAGALVISHDALTGMLHAEYRYEPQLREMYRAMEETLAELAVYRQRPVIIDRTHLTRESRQRWTKFAREMPTAIRAVVFKCADSPFEHAKRRFEADPRGRRLNEWASVAEHHYEQWLNEPLKDWRGEGFSEEPLLVG